MNFSLKFHPKGGEGVTREEMETVACSQAVPQRGGEERQRAARPPQAELNRERLGSGLLGRSCVNVKLLSDASPRV